MTQNGHQRWTMAGHTPAALCPGNEPIYFNTLWYAGLLPHKLSNRLVEGLGRERWLATRDGVICRLFSFLFVVTQPIRL